jgi:hypothetical protein
MEPTSSFYRTQEALQRDRAAHSALENVRIIAERAANAWAEQATLAERKEAKKARAGIVDELLSLQKQRLDDDDG